ncbi:hypothetical protein M758_4G026200 [Ceratodon purpureus]|nr:hypothetical protein M758_4G026200 [Ceratodon purpureus]
MLEESRNHFKLNWPILMNTFSDDLREFFELNYGPVVDAVVIGSQAGDQMQSRGFGFVTFKHAASVSAAVEAHYINIYGKKVEIKGAVPRSELPALEVSRADSDTPIEPLTAMSANKVLDLDEADVLEVATPGSLSLPKEEVSQCNQRSSMADPQKVSPSECAPSYLIGSLPSSRVSNVSSDSISKSVIQEATSESASSTSHGLPSANVPSVSRDSFSQSVMRGCPSGHAPAWLNTFKEWLPEFLTRVSMRLKEGEWYPLSSLKGDYRAICGLELDHVSLGFEKLSDFVRSFPELCRMKIVPVGRGPATHMVLLPPHTRTKPLVAARRNLSNITTRSLVDGTRSYAEVACHGSAPRVGRPDTVPSSHPAFCTGGTNLVRPVTHTGVPSSTGERIYPTDRQPPMSFSLRQQNFSLRENGLTAPYAAAAGYNPGMISSSNAPLRTTITRAEGHSRSDSSNGTTVTSNSSSSDRSGRSGSNATLVHADDTETLSAGEISSSDVNSGLSEEELGLLQELISRLKKTGVEHVPARNHAATGSQPGLVTMHDALASPRRKAPPGYQASLKPMKNFDNDRDRSIYHPFFDQEPKTPSPENNPPSTPFNHPFAGFLPENFPSNSSMWSQDTNSGRINEGGYGIPGRGVENFNPACQFDEESPNSSNSIYSTPRGYLPLSSSPGQGYPKISGTCEICFERQAMWVAVPCGHKNMCSLCKGSLRQDSAKCFVCTGYVERWIALH